jgi:uncharacterized membrane protein
MRREWPWLSIALGLLAVGWLFTFVVPPFSDSNGLDVAHFAVRATHWLQGRLPYRDLHFEYPPLAVPVIWLPGLVKVGSYKFGFGLLAFASAAVCVGLTGVAARQSGGDRRLALLAVATTPFLLGAIVRGYFDFVPTALLLGALVALLAGRSLAGFVLLGLAVMTKGYAIVVAPIAIAWLLARGERRAALIGTAAMAVTIAMVLGAGMLLSASGEWWALHYQLARPAEVESTPALVLVAADWIGGARHGHIVHTYGSWNLIHHGAGGLDDGFAALLLASVVALTLAVRRSPTPRALLVASLAAVAAFAVFGKVFSPQYAIWVVPLLGLAAAWREWAAAALAAVAILLSRIEYPADFGDVLRRRPGAIVLVDVRNLAVVALIGASLWMLRVQARRLSDVGRTDSSRQMSERACPDSH